MRRDERLQNERIAAFHAELVGGGVRRHIRDAAHRTLWAIKIGFDIGPVLVQRPIGIAIPSLCSRTHAAKQREARDRLRPVVQ